MDVFMGFISAFGFTYPPRDWVLCAGQYLAIDDNQALYSLLGDFYGGDMRTVYGIPELRGRMAVGYGQSPGLPMFKLGNMLGFTDQFLSTNEMPSHTHTATVSDGDVAVGAVLNASQENGDNAQPEVGDYLATSFKASGDLNKSYVAAADKGVLVELGGLEVGGMDSPPAVVNEDTGLGGPFSIMQPILAVNYCLATQGIYPPRN